MYRLTYPQSIGVFFQTISYPFIWSLPLKRTHILVRWKEPLRLQVSIPLDYKVTSILINSVGAFLHMSCVRGQTTSLFLFFLHKTAGTCLADQRAFDFVSVQPKVSSSATSCILYSYETPGPRGSLCHYAIGLVLSLYLLLWYHSCSGRK